MLRIRPARRYSCELLTKDMHIETLQNISSLDGMREELNRIAQSGRVILDSAFSSGEPQRLSH